MNEGEAFIREAAADRGIDPETALVVADSEGGRDAPGLVGKFPTGWSFWQYQLHYGGAGYEHYGTTAGMGNGFTELTGWPPGEDAAWRDACRYALNRAKSSGWGAWYGAAASGVSTWEGIDTSYPWDPNSEVWDFETAAPTTPTTGVVYNREEPVHLQDQSYDCSQESLEWALWALGRRPSDDWLTQTMIAEGVMTPELGCTDASGAGLAAFVVRHYGEDGFDANNETDVSWEWLCREGGAIPPGDGSLHGYPVLIGGRAWYHWAVVREYDPTANLLLLANSAPGWGGVDQTMSGAQFDRLGPFNAVRVWHPDVLGPDPPPDVVPIPPEDTRLARVRALATEIVAVCDEPYPPLK